MTRDREEDVTAYLDGELDEMQALELREAMAASESLAALERELAATKAGLAALFEDDLKEYPESPSAVSLLACADFAELPPEEERKARRSSARFAAVAAILVAVSATIIFWPSETVEAAAAEVLVERAASRFDSLKDVELELRIDLVGGGGEDGKRMRTLVSKEFGAVVFERVGGRGERAVAGAKGDRAWKFDEERGVVVTRPFDPAERAEFMGEDPRTPEQRRQDPFGLTLMSFEMVKRFTDGGDCKLEETTGPFHRRIGRRAFRMTWDEGKKKSLLEAFTPRSMQIVIDPRTDLIERMQYQLSMLVFVLDITVEVAEVDQGLPARVFDFRNYHPDVEVIAEDD